MCCLCVVYALSMFCLCLVYVLSMFCLCLVFVLPTFCLFFVYVLSMSCLCVVYVLSMRCLCFVFVLSMCCLCFVYVFSLSCLRFVYFLSMSCLCLVYVLSMSPPLPYHMTTHYVRRRNFPNRVIYEIWRKNLTVSDRRTDGQTKWGIDDRATLLKTNMLTLPWPNKAVYTACEKNPTFRNSQLQLNMYGFKEYQRRCIKA